MRALRRGVAATFLAAQLSFALAVQPGEQLNDSIQEARARRLSGELRCLVCQNQSIDDSDAPLARDLRRLVRERIMAGDDDARIRAFLVARYGEFVLLRPAFSAQTWLLWLLPAAALVLGGIAAASLFRRGRTKIEEAQRERPLSAEEQNELARLLKD